jgi:hypothetical protein
MAAGLTWRFDGAKWVVSDVRESGSSITSPVSGGTIVLAHPGVYYINNADVLALLTIRLPLGVLDDEVHISFHRPITSLVVQDSLGAAIPDAPTNAYGPGAGLVFKYVDDVVKWVYWK